MDKIILVDGRFEDIALLKACFGMLFPDCEIRTMPGGSEGNKGAAEASEWKEKT